MNKLTETALLICALLACVWIVVSIFQIINAATCPPCPACPSTGLYVPCDDAHPCPPGLVCEVGLDGNRFCVRPSSVEADLERCWP